MFIYINAGYRYANQTAATLDHVTYVVKSHVSGYGSKESFLSPDCSGCKHRQHVFFITFIAKQKNKTKKRHGNVN